MILFILELWDVFKDESIFLYAYNEYKDNDELKDSYIEKMGNRIRDNRLDKDVQIPDLETRHEIDCLDVYWPYKFLHTEEGSEERKDVMEKHTKYMKEKKYLEQDFHLKNRMASIDDKEHTALVDSSSGEEEERELPGPKLKKHRTSSRLAKQYAEHDSMMVRNRVFVDSVLPDFGNVEFVVDKKNQSRILSWIY